MTQGDPVTGLELETLIRRGMQGEAVDVVDPLLRTQVVVPSGGAVGPAFDGFVPVVYDRDGATMLAIFTSLERALRVTDLARYAVTMTGRDLLLRMPAAHGLVVNPGHDVGFELFPDAVRAISQRMRAGARSTNPPPLTPEQYQSIGRGLAQVAPRRWAAVELTVVCVGPETRSTIGVRMPGGRVVKARGPVPRDVTRLLRDLRREAYRPGVGTWFTARVVVEAAGGVTIDFDYDNPPPLVPAPDSWAEELRRFPRDPQHVPSWLRLPAADAAEWLGARWQIDLRPAGVGAQPVTSIDATTTPQGHVWAMTLAERLSEHGIPVRIGQDQGEDGRGNATTYEQLLVTVGQGDMALAFWRDLVFWTVDVFPDQADRATFSGVASRVLAEVQEVTGYRPDLTHVGAYERALIDPGGTGSGR